MRGTQAGWAPGTRFHAPGCGGAAAAAEARHSWRSPSFELVVVTVERVIDPLEGDGFALAAQAVDLLLALEAPVVFLPQGGTIAQRALDFQVDQVGCALRGLAGAGAASHERLIGVVVELVADGEGDERADRKSVV